MKKLVLVLSGMMLALLCAACGDNGGGADGGVTCPDPNFVSIHDLVLSQNTCARAGCHNGAQAQGGLDFAGGADAVFAELGEPTVNTSAAQSMRLAATADDSFLYVKVSTPGPGIMPPGGMLSQCEQDAIRDWINGGGAR